MFNDTGNSTKRQDTRTFRRVKVKGVRRLPRNQETTEGNSNFISNAKNKEERNSVANIVGSHRQNFHKEKESDAATGGNEDKSSVKHFPKQNKDRIIVNVKLDKNPVCISAGDINTTQIKKKSTAEMAEIQTKINKTLMTHHEDENSILKNLRQGKKCEAAKIERDLITQTSNIKITKSCLNDTEVEKVTHRVGEVANSDSSTENITKCEDGELLLLNGELDNLFNEKRISEDDKKNDDSGIDLQAKTSCEEPTCFEEKSQYKESSDYRSKFGRFNINHSDDSLSDYSTDADWSDDYCVGYSSRSENSSNSETKHPSGARNRSRKGCHERRKNSLHSKKGNDCDSSDSSTECESSRKKESSRRRRREVCDSSDSEEPDSRTTHSISNKRDSSIDIDRQHKTSTSGSMQFTSGRKDSNSKSNNKISASTSCRRTCPPKEDNQYCFSDWDYSNSEHRASTDVLEVRSKNENKKGKGRNQGNLYQETATSNKGIYNYKTNRIEYNRNRKNASDIRENATPIRIKVAKDYNCEFPSLVGNPDNRTFPTVHQPMGKAIKEEKRKQALQSVDHFYANTLKGKETGKANGEGGNETQNKKEKEFTKEEKRREQQGPSNNTKIEKNPPINEMSLQRKEQTGKKNLPKESEEMPVNEEEISRRRSNMTQSQVVEGPVKQLAAIEVSDEEAKQREIVCVKSDANTAGHLDISVESIEENQLYHERNMLNFINDIESIEKFFTEKEKRTRMEQKGSALQEEEKSGNTNVESGGNGKANEYRFRVKDDVLMMEVLTIQDELASITERISSSYGIFKSHWSPTDEDIWFWKDVTALLEMEQDLDVLNVEELPTSLVKESICRHDCYFSTGRRLIVET